MKNTLKVIFLGIVGFGFLVYLTIPEKKVSKNENLTIDSIPQYFDIVGNKSYSKIDTLFKLGEEKYIVFLNHDSLIVFKDLYKKVDKNNIVLVANISEAPWLVKKIAVNDEFAEITIDAIIKAARSHGEESGEIGDGKIFITNLEECIRIRTGERGSLAI